MREKKNKAKGKRKWLRGVEVVEGMSGMLKGRGGGVGMQRRRVEEEVMGWRKGA